MGGAEANAGVDPGDQVIILITPEALKSLAISGHRVARPLLYAGA
jgi:hypothetical protein